MHAISAATAAAEAVGLSAKPLPPKMVLVTGKASATALRAAAATWRAQHQGRTSTSRHGQPISPRLGACPPNVARATRPAARNMYRPKRQDAERFRPTARKRRLRPPTTMAMAAGGHQRGGRRWRSGHDENGGGGEGGADNDDEGGGWGGCDNNGGGGEGNGCKSGGGGEDDDAEPGGGGQAGGEGGEGVGEDGDGKAAPPPTFISSGPPGLLPSLASNARPPTASASATRHPPPARRLRRSVNPTLCHQPSQAARPRAALLAPTEDNPPPPTRPNSSRLASRPLWCPRLPGSVRRPRAMRSRERVSSEVSLSRLDKSWHPTGAGLLLHRYCTGTALVLHWHCSPAALHCYYSAVPAVCWHRISTAMVLHKHRH